MQHSLILIIVSLDHSTASNIYINSNGSNKENCGPRKEPCRTLEYTIKKVITNNDIIILTNSRFRAYIVTEPILLTVRNVSIIGDGNHPAIVYSKRPVTLLQLNSSASISIFNIIFRKMGLFSYDSAQSTSLDKHSLAIEIHRTSFREAPVVVDITFRSPIGKSYINISESSIFNSKKGIWIDTVNHSNEIIVHISEILIQGMTNSPLYVVMSNTTHDDVQQGSLPIYKDYLATNTTTAGKKSGKTSSRRSSINKMAINIESCVFKDNIITSDAGGIVYLQARLGVQYVVVLRNTKFNANSNKVFSKGGAVYIDIRHGNNINVYLDNVTFVDNEAGFAGGGLGIIALRKNVINVTVLNSKFVRNEAQDNGAGIGFKVDHENVIDVHMEGSVFMANNAGYSGMAISLYVAADRLPYNSIDLIGFKDNRKEMRIVNSNFTHNKCYFGGAIYLDSSELANKEKCPNEDIFSFVITIEKSLFNSNQAKHKGGAVYVSYSAAPFFTLNIDRSSFISNTAGAGGGIYITNGKVYVTNSNFLRNSAEHGGALNYKEGSTSITGCEFHENTASTFGGAIYLQGEQFKHVFGSFFRTIENSIFTNTIENSVDAAMFYGLADLEIINSSFILRDDGVYKNQHSIYPFVHDSTLQITSPFNITCPSNYRLLNKTIYKLIDDNQRDYNKFDYLAIKCVPCGKGTYSVKGSAYYWDSLSQFSLTNQINCMKCPAGGDCDNGNIVSLPNYWGYKYNSNIKFINCPFGYCSSNSTTYNSCAGNRKGYLCGECVDGHRLSLFSTYCVDKTKCQENFEWMVTIVIIIAFIVLLVVFFLKEITSVSKKMITWLKQTLFKDDDDEVGGFNGELFFSSIRLIFFFYQLQRFTKVPLKNSSDSFSPKLQHVLGTIFSMSFVESVNEAISICPSDEFNSVHKKMITVFLWIIILLVCLILYGLLCCLRVVNDRYYFKINDITPRFQAIFIQLLILSYIPVSTSFFQLVHCVDLNDRGNQLNVLYTQGNIKCYQTWQYFVIAFLSVWTAPFVISIYIGTSLLHKRVIKTKHFFLTLVCPWSAVYFYFKLKRHSIHNASSEMRLSTVQRSESSYLNTIEPDATVPISIDDVDCGIRSSVRSVKFCDRCSKNEPDNEKKSENDNTNIERTDDEYTKHDDMLLHENETANQQREEPSMGASEHERLNIRKLDAISEEQNRKDILEKLQGSFKYEYWLSVQKLRNIILVIVFTFTDNIVQRLYVMGVVLLIFLIIHFKKKPFKEKVMNWLESSLQTMLIVLDVMSIFDTMQFYGIPETDDIIGLRTVFWVVKIFILILPLPLLGFYMFVFRCKEQNSKERYADDK